MLIPDIQIINIVVFTNSKETNLTKREDAEWNHDEQQEKLRPETNINCF